ncbi:MAG: hypothetical protein HKN94_03320 [Acidimicrobiales bacterium]|nr:hypothetical protein [Acidimicrobiales bacterium]RZV46081.1 MAG: hypothetical protein EX269_08240 [Acidimicrobiales bacterium]
MVGATVDVVVGATVDVVVGATVDVVVGATVDVVTAAVDVVVDRGAEVVVVVVKLVAGANVAGDVPLDDATAVVVEGTVAAMVLSVAVGDSVGADVVVWDCCTGGGDDSDFERTSVFTRFVGAVVAGSVASGGAEVAAAATELVDVSFVGAAATCRSGEVVVVVSAVRTARPTLEVMFASPRLVVPVCSRKTRQRARPTGRPMLSKKALIADRFDRFPSTRLFT